MQCPRCFQSDVSIVGDSHYVCNNPECVDDDGKRTQFYIAYDDHKRFPYSQIFMFRPITSFYRKPYLKVADAGDTSM